MDRARFGRYDGASTRSCKVQLTIELVGARQLLSDLFVGEVRRTLAIAPRSTLSGAQHLRHSRPESNLAVARLPGGGAIESLSWIELRVPDLQPAFLKGVPVELRQLADRLLDLVSRVAINRLHVERVATDVAREISLLV